MNTRSFLFILSCMLACSCGVRKKLESTRAERDQLQHSLTALDDNNEAMQGELVRLRNHNMQLNDALDQYEIECSEAMSDLEAIQEELEAMDASMEAITSKLENVLADFRQKGVDIYRKEGQIYVSLQEALLYESGSVSLKAEGRRALSSLAAALNEYPRLKVVVVGNTDDRQFKSGRDNWTLSTERANGVVRILRDYFKIDPARLTSAGKSKYAPIADNSTPEGRAKNRRTEIILSPDLGRLMAFMDR